MREIGQPGTAQVGRLAVLMACAAAWPWIVVGEVSDEQLVQLESPSHVVRELKQIQNIVEVPVRLSNLTKGTVNVRVVGKSCTCIGNSASGALLPALGAGELTLQVTTDKKAETHGWAIFEASRSGGGRQFIRVSFSVRQDSIVGLRAAPTVVVFGNEKNREILADLLFVSAPIENANRKPPSMEVMADVAGVRVDLTTPWRMGNQADHWIAQARITLPERGPGLAIEPLRIWIRDEPECRTEIRLRNIESGGP